MSRLVFERKPVKFAAARLAGALAPGRGAAVGPLKLEPDESLPLPGPDWVRLTPLLSGICGSDLALIDGTASAYFDPLVSYPFTPGHEVVGRTEDGRRVVLIPVLHCAIRGIEPMCDMCTMERTNLCERVAFGHLDAGLQSGFCTDTGGGWSNAMIAHSSQLVDVPDDLSDEAAVMIEPTACAVHAAERYTGGEAVIIGAGTVGLLTLAAITAARATNDPGLPVIVAARYAEQRRLAKELGADIVCTPDEMPRWVRSLSRSMVMGDQLSCGFDRVIDCVGSSSSLQQALQVVAPGGEVQMVGMPANVSVELTSLWHREVSIRGCYAYTRDDFVAAIDVVRRFDLGRLVSATYPLDDYKDAIAHAASAGRRGAVKIAFDMRGRP